MPYFQYKAVTQEGQADEGRVFADSAAAVIADLQKAGRIPILAEEVRTGSTERRRRPALRLRRGHGRPDVGAFTGSLATLLAASVPLDRALQIMSGIETDEATSSLIREIQTGVRSGASLSETLEEQGASFSRFYVAMVRAAEASGTLAEGLSGLAAHMEKSEELRDKVVSALIYPAILVLVAGLSVILLLMYVVPQFRPIFDEMGSALPLATRLTLGVSDFVAANAMWIAAGLAAVIFGTRRLLAREGGRRRIDEILLRLPVVSSLVRALQTARFSRSLGTLMKNGVPILQGLGIACETMSNRVMVAAVEEATDSLREGGKLSTTLLDAAVFPDLAMQLLKVGEESGSVDTMMLRVAEVYDREVEKAIQRMLSLLEPVLIIGLGIVIAGIIMSVLIGIISINDLPL